MPLKINLGRIVPGFFLFLSGIMLLIIWALASLVSLFISIPGLPLLLLLALALSLMIGGIVEILSGISGIFGYIRKR